MEDKKLYTYKLVDKEKFLDDQRDDYNEYILENYALGDKDLLIGSFNENGAFNIEGTEEYLNGREVFDCFMEVKEDDKPYTYSFDYEEYMVLPPLVEEKPSVYVSYFHASKVVLGKDVLLLELSLLLVLYTTLGSYLGIDLDFMFKLCNITAGFLFTVYSIQVMMWLSIAKEVVAKAQDGDHVNLLLYDSWFKGEVE